MAGNFRDSGFCEVAESSLERIEPSFSGSLDFEGAPAGGNFAEVKGHIAAPQHRDGVEGVDCRDNQSMCGCLI